MMKELDKKIFKKMGTVELAKKDFDWDKPVTFYIKTIQFFDF